MIAHIYTPTLFDICDIDIHGLFNYFFLSLIFSHRISWILNQQETQTTTSQSQCRPGRELGTSRAVPRVAQIPMVWGRDALML